MGFVPILSTQQTTLKLLTSSLTPWFMKPMKVKNSDKISVHISGDVMIRYNWNLKIVNIGILANKYAGLNKKPAKKDNTVTLRTYLVTNGVSRQYDSYAVSTGFGCGGPAILLSRGGTTTGGILYTLDNLGG